MEAHFEHERQEYENTIAALEEQSEQREQKYKVRSSAMFFYLFDLIRPEVKQFILITMIVSTNNKN